MPHTMPRTTSVHTAAYPTRQVKTLPGASRADSHYIDGLVCRMKLAHKSMVTHRPRYAHATHTLRTRHAHATHTLRTRHAHATH